jgi:hypothetical protein
MMPQADSDSYSLKMTEAITDYRKDEAVAFPKIDTTPSGQKTRPRKTTVGWLPLEKWADGSESWIPLKDIKKSHLIETAEFAKARSIADEPAFAWWVP